MPTWIRCFLLAFLLTASGYAAPSILILTSAPSDREFVVALEEEVSDLGITVLQRAAPNPDDLRSRALLLHQVVRAPEFVAGVWLEVKNERASVYIFDAISRTFRVRRLPISKLLSIEAGLIVRALVSALIAGEPLEAEAVPVPEPRALVVARRETKPVVAEERAPTIDKENRAKRTIGFVEGDLLLGSYLESYEPVFGGQFRAGLELPKPWFLSLAGAMYGDTLVQSESFDLGLRRFSTRLGVGLRYDVGPLELRGSVGPLLDFSYRWSIAKSPEVVVPPATTLVLPGAYVELDLSIQVGTSSAFVLGGGAEFTFRQLRFTADLEGEDVSFTVLPIRPRLQLGLRFLF